MHTYNIHLSDNAIRCLCKLASHWSLIIVLSKIGAAWRTPSEGGQRLWWSVGEPIIPM